MRKDDSRPLTRDLAPFGVRMPPDLKDRIQAAAESNNRSMNSEIVATLEKAYPVPKTDFLEAFGHLMDRDAAIWAVIEPLLKKEQSLPPGAEQLAIREELKLLFAQSQELKRQIQDLLSKADKDESDPRSSAYRAKKRSASPPDDQ